MGHIPHLMSKLKFEAFVVSIVECIPILECINFVHVLTRKKIRHIKQCNAEFTYRQKDTA